MERVETLLKKLQEQFAQKAPSEQLLLTVQMLQAELLHLQAGNTTPFAQNNITVTIFENAGTPRHEEPLKKEDEQPEEEKTVEVLQVNEADIEAELEEIRHNAEQIQKISSQNKPPILFDMGADIPTLSHQHPLKTGPQKKEVNENVSVASTSINEKLKQSKIDLGDALTEVPIRDLRKAIGVNDRFLFIHELFRGDEVIYERSIKTINGFSILAEAEYWIQRELKVKNGWNDNDEIVKQFYLLVKRRFS